MPSCNVPISDVFMISIMSARNEQNATDNENNNEHNNKKEKKKLNNNERKPYSQRQNQNVASQN